MSSFDEFKQRFVFNSLLTGLVGVEREAFLRPYTGGPVVPKAQLVCQVLEKEGRNHNEFGPELSACQIESRVGPVEFFKLQNELEGQTLYLRDVLRKLDLAPDYSEVAEATMSTEVFPNERYLRIKEVFPPEKLLAACRVTGTHVHIGMPNLSTAFRVYNKIIEHTEELVRLGDSSLGERMRLYRIVSPHSAPQKLASIQHLYELAQEQGFAENLRNWWSLIRITRYGTIEFRMFGNTSSAEKVVDWASRCHELCLDAL